jgi:hypothetical protein
MSFAAYQRPGKRPSGLGAGEERGRGCVSLFLAFRRPTEQHVVNADRRVQRVEPEKQPACGDLDIVGVGAEGDDRPDAVETKRDH